MLIDHGPPNLSSQTSGGISEWRDIRARLLGRARREEHESQIEEVQYAANVRLRDCLLAISGFAFCQAPTSDTQTLQALLSEVRALRQDIHVSLGRTQTMQILLVRFQMQEGAIARASDHANDARQRLLETHVHQKEQTAEVKRLEDLLDTAQNPQQQADWQDRLKQIKSELQIAGDIAQQRQAEEIRAEQQLRDEQDKLSALETQLDELIRGLGSSAEQSSRTK